MLLFYYFTFYDLSVSVFLLSVASVLRSIFALYIWIYESCVYGGRISFCRLLGRQLLQYSTHVRLAAMAGENKGPLRHIVLLKVEKKEDVPEVVETLSKMSKEIVKHVSWLNFDINSDLGLPLSTLNSTQLKQNLLSMYVFQYNL